MDDVKGNQGSNYIETSWVGRWVMGAGVEQRTNMISHVFNGITWLVC